MISSNPPNNIITLIRQSTVVSTVFFVIDYVHIAKHMTCYATERLTCCLVGAKSDLLDDEKPRVISDDEISSFLKTLDADAQYVEVSSKENINVETPFKIVASTSLKKKTRNTKSLDNVEPKKEDPEFSNKFKSIYTEIYLNKSTYQLPLFGSAMKGRVLDSADRITREEAETQAHKYPKGTAAAALERMMSK